MLIPGVAEYALRFSHVVDVHVPVAESNEHPAGVHADAPTRFSQANVTHALALAFHVHPATPSQAVCPAPVYDEHGDGSQASSETFHVHAPVHAAGAVIVEHEAAQAEPLHAQPGCAPHVADVVFDAHASGFHVVLDCEGAPPGVP